MISHTHTHTHTPTHRQWESCDYGRKSKDLFKATNPREPQLICIMIWMFISHSGGLQYIKPSSVWTILLKSRYTTLISNRTAVYYIFQHVSCCVFTLHSQTKFLQQCQTHVCQYVCMYVIYGHPVAYQADQKPTNICQTCVRTLKDPCVCSGMSGVHYSRTTACEGISCVYGLAFPHISHTEK